MNLWLYVGLFTMGFGIGSLGMNRWDQASYERLQAKFSQYQAQVAQANEASQKAATEALQAQAKEHQTTEARNAAIIEGLNHENLSLRAARKFTCSLLASGSKAVSPAGSDKGGTGTGESGADDPAKASSDRRLTSDVENGAIEARECVNRLNALQAELAPQLRSH